MAPPVYLTPPGNLPMRRFRVDEYHRMIQSGILGIDERVELLDGWIVKQMTRNPPHDVSLDKSQDALRAALPAGGRLRVQSAITTTESEPEPDFAVVPGPAERYRTNHPRPEEVATLIEVSESSLDYDRRTKGPLYARARIPIYWIINLIDALVEVYTDPSGPDPSPAYRKHQDFLENDSVPLVIDGQEVGRIAVRDLLP
jgi:hypothetical protein